MTVSVIIPVYKTAEYLPLCVDSVCNQTYGDLEIILVDDGSPDEAPFICDRYALVDRRVKVIHKENGGLSSARNAGLDICTGDYVLFLDSDDYLLNNTVSFMIDDIVSCSADMAVCGMLYKYGDEIETMAEDSITVTDGISALYKLYTNEIAGIVTSCGKLYARHLFDNIRFPQGMINEDEYITPKLFYASKSIVFNRKTGYIYVQHGGQGITRTGFYPKKLDVINIMKDRSECFRNWGLTELYNLSIRDYFCHLLRLYRQTKNKKYRNEHKSIIAEIKSINQNLLSTGQRMRRLLLLFDIYPKGRIQDNTHAPVNQKASS